MKQKGSEICRKDQRVTIRKLLQSMDLRRTKVSCERFEKSSVCSTELREIELSSTLRLYQQADASKRRPVCIYTRYFPGFARSFQVSNSLRRDVSTNPGAKRLGCFFCLWHPDSRESQSRASWNVRWGGYRKVLNFITRTKTGKPK